MEDTGDRLKRAVHIGPGSSSFCADMRRRTRRSTSGESRKLVLRSCASARSKTSNPAKCASARTPSVPVTCRRRRAASMRPANSSMSNSPASKDWASDSAALSLGSRKWSVGSAGGSGRTSSQTGGLAIQARTCDWTHNFAVAAGLWVQRGGDSMISTMISAQR